MREETTTEYSHYLFKPYDILEAEQLNEMNDQIYRNMENINAIKGGNGTLENNIFTINTTPSNLSQDITSLKNSNYKNIVINVELDNSSPNNEDFLITPIEIDGICQNLKIIGNEDNKPTIPPLIINNICECEIENVKFIANSETKSKKIKIIDFNNDIKNIKYKSYRFSGSSPNKTLVLPLILETYDSIGKQNSAIFSSEGKFSTSYQDYPESDSKTELTFFTIEERNYNEKNCNDLILKNGNYLIKNCIFGNEEYCDNMIDLKRRSPLGLCIEQSEDNYLRVYDERFPWEPFGRLREEGRTKFFNQPNNNGVFEDGKTTNGYYYVNENYENVPELSTIYINSEPNIKTEYALIKIYNNEFNNDAEIERVQLKYSKCEEENNSFYPVGVYCASGLDTSGWNRTIKKVRNLQDDRQVLILGDSIAAGARNGYIGFAEGLSYPYRNLAVGGSCLARPAQHPVPTEVNPKSVNSSDDTYCIADRLTMLINLPHKLHFIPDIVILNGGINDYNAYLPIIDPSTTGALDNKPYKASFRPPLAARDSTFNPQNNDENAIVSALRYIFYTLNTKYNMPEIIFIWPHKVKNYNIYKNPNNGTYLPNTKSPATYRWINNKKTPVYEITGEYTFDDLKEALREVCEVGFGHKFVDISKISTSVYSSTINNYFYQEGLNSFTNTFNITNSPSTDNFLHRFSKLNSISPICFNSYYDKNRQNFIKINPNFSHPTSSKKAFYPGDNNNQKNEAEEHINYFKKLLCYDKDNGEEIINPNDITDEKLKEIANNPETEKEKRCWIQYFYYNSLFNDDGVHPLDKGYKTLYAPEILKAISKKI